MVPPDRPVYESWRDRGCCNASAASTSGSSSPLAKNATLYSYLYPTQPTASLAIATVHTVGRSRSAGCGIVKWCFSARAFATSALFPPGAADVIVLTNNETWARDECRTPGVKFIAADPTLEALVRAWGESQPWPGASLKRSRPPRPVTLMKWQLFRLYNYRAVFYHDVDVDLFLQSNGKPPPAASAAFATLATAWTRGYEAFLRSGSHLLALRDTHIAINTGTMLLRPSHQVYAIGISALTARRFNFSHGFDLVGRPRAVLPVASMARADAKRLRDSRMYRMNTWDVVCGDGDQGLFTYVFLVVLRGRSFAYPVRDGGMRVHHFYALHKPWGKKTRCLQYFAFLRDAAFIAAGRQPHQGQLDRRTLPLESSASLSHAPTPSTTHCARKLEEKRGCLEASQLSDAQVRSKLCAECIRNGQKSSCPMRKLVRLPNGTRRVLTFTGAPQCPTSSTRWWVF